MIREIITDKLSNHKEWLSSAMKRGERFIFNGEYHGTLLAGANLRGAVLSGAALESSDIRNANLESTQLECTSLLSANLRNSNLRNSNLRNSNLIFADLINADLTGANLIGANLIGANLIGANLTDVKGLISTKDFMDKTFETTSEGYIVYKVFDYQYRHDSEWEIKPGSTIQERQNVFNCDRRIQYGRGINVAPYDMAKAISCSGTIIPTVVPQTQLLIWKCIIKYEWLDGVCAPYATDGKIRCNKLQLIEIID